MMTLYSLMFARSKAEVEDCPAGYSCLYNQMKECETGWYSLEGDLECERCPEGHYCSTTTDEPKECEAGEYSLLAYTECKKCPAGYVCKVTNGKTQFVRCPLGQYSKEGSTQCLGTPKGYMSASPTQEPIPCLDGYYSTEENSTYCQLCKRGYFCKEKDQEPQICPEGTYSGLGATECTQCPSKKYCPEGSTTPMDCPPDNPLCRLEEYSEVSKSGRRELATSCPSGEYLIGDTCYDCPEGYKCTGGTDAPVRCGANTYSGAKATGCTPCGAGFICPTPRQSDRYQCQAGFVAESNLYCRPCAEGKYCPNGYQELDCDATGANRNYSPGGLSACETCPLGKECHSYTYIDCTEGFYYEASNDTCTECPVGHFCRNNVKTQCDEGEYMPFKGFSFCLECPVNTRCPTTGMSAYLDCTHNQQWSEPGSLTCTDCELDHECFVGYSVPCPANYYSPVSEYECWKCPEGKSCNPADRTDQNNCAAGTYSPAGAIYCYTCPAGYFCPSTKMSSPLPCPPGEYTSTSGQTSCLTCANGEFSSTPGTANCNTLPSGHYSLSTKAAAIPCPVGTYPTANEQGCQACTAG